MGLLDYILSKMVLLIFLLLLVAAFTMVRESLTIYFVQQSASNLASALADNVTRVLTSVRSTHEVKIYRLPPALEAGNIRLPYDLKVEDYERGNIKYVGIAILDHVRGRAIAFDTVPVGDKKKVQVKVPKDSITSSALKEQYFIVERTYDPGTGITTLKICVKTEPTGCG